MKRGSQEMHRIVVVCGFPNDISSKKCSANDGAASRLMAVYENADQKQWEGEVVWEARWCGVRLSSALQLSDSS